MASGILIVDKPEDWTSQDVVAKLRGALHERRAGHGGTLDPMATGVLPVFFGRATRAVEFFEHAEKTYETVLCLGLVTDTQDTTGETLEEHAVTVTEDEVRAALSQPGLPGRFAMYGEAYKKIAVPDDVPEDLRGLYVRRGFGLEHSGTPEDWKLLGTHGMADLLAQDLAAMAPLQQLMQRMRQQAEHAQQEQQREREEKQRAALRGELDARPARLRVRSAEEFEF